MQAPSSDSAARADSLTFERLRAAGAEPVPLRVTEVREIPGESFIGPTLALLATGALIGCLLGAWWRGRRRP